MKQAKSIEFEALRISSCSLNFPLMFSNYKLLKNNVRPLAKTSL